MKTVKKIILSLFVLVTFAGNHVFAMQSGAKQRTSSVMASLLLPDKYEFDAKAPRFLSKGSPSGASSVSPVSAAPVGSPSALTEEPSSPTMRGALAQQAASVAQGKGLGSDSSSDISVALSVGDDFGNASGDDWRDLEAALIPAAVGPANLKFADLDNVAKVEAVLFVNDALDYDQIVNTAWKAKLDQALRDYTKIDL